MINNEMVLSGDLLKYTVKLQQLEEAINKLKDVRIACTVNLDVCFMLMKDAMQADSSEREESIKALAYAIKITARQVRLEISQKPRRANMLKNISLDSKKVEVMKLGTYRSLAPFALKVFEDF